MPNIKVNFPAKIVIELDAEMSEYSEETPIGVLWEKARQYAVELDHMMHKSLESWKVKSIHVECTPETNLKRVS